MNVLDSSLFYRAAARSVDRFTVACRDSLVGRFFMLLARTLARVFGASVTFGLGRAESRPLGSEGHSRSVSLLAGSYLGLRRIMGPVAEAGRAGVQTSAFSAGGWLRVVGAGAFALGGARAVATGASSGAGLLSSILLMIVGGLLVLGGPIVGPAFRGSIILGGVKRAAVAVVEGRSSGGGSSQTASGLQKIGHPQRSPLLWAAVLAALVGGAAGGVSTGRGPLVVAAIVVVMSAVALVLRRPEVLLLAAAAFPWIDQAARWALGDVGAAWDDAFLLVSVLVLLWAVIFLRRARLWTVPILLPLVLAFVVAVGSVVVNHVPGSVGLYSLRILFQPVLFFFLGFLFPKDRRWVQWVVAVFVFAGVVLALHGLYQYVVKAPMPASWVDVREAGISTRAYSVIGNPNGLGAFLVMGVLLTLSLALRSGLRPLQRWTMAGACVVQVAGVAVTFSRGAWLGLAAGLIALLVMSYRRYLVPLVGVGVVGWLAAPSVLTERLAFAFSSEYLAKSLIAGRLYVWELALLHVVRHPLLGVGLGTFGGTAAITFGYGRLWVDNFYLQLAAEGGVILLGLFLWLLLRAGKGLVRAYRSTDDKYCRAFAAGVFGAYVAVCVANITAGVWETLVVGAGFWFMAGLASSAPVQRKETV